MFGLGWFEILLIVLLIVVLFGKGKISDLMGDVAQGIKSFKKGLSDDEPVADKNKTIEADVSRTSEQYDFSKKEKTN